MPSDPKTIGVFLDDSSAGRARLAFACELALAFRAHVSAIFVDSIPGAVRSENAPVVFARGAGMDDAIDRYFDPGRASVVDLRRRLDAWGANAGLSWTWRHAPAYASLREMSHRCAYADLLVLPTFDRDSVGEPWTSPALVFASGVPGIIVPATTPRCMPRNVMIAWNATRVARRAVGDAVPFLRRAERVTIVVVETHARPSSTAAEDGADLAMMLERRGIACAIDVIPPSGTATSEILLQSAARLGADLVVAGAYGHSRIVEVALGSTTRALLRDEAVCFLISH